MTCKTCGTWARQGDQFLTNHHPYCPHIAEDPSDRQRLEENPDLLEKVSAVFTLRQIVEGWNRP